MTEQRWQVFAAAAPVGLAALVGGATWVTLTAQPHSPQAGPAADSGTTASPRPTVDRHLVALRHQINAESRRVRHLQARLDDVHRTTRTVLASTPTVGSSTGGATVSTSTSGGTGSGWQAPSIPSSNPAPANPPPTQTTTGASGTTPP